MVGSMPSDEGPYLLAAVICERVLVEQDGVKSAIRIIDRLTRTARGPNPPEEMQPFDYDCFLFIRLKSGPLIRGVRTLRLKVVSPLGERRAAHRMSVLFEGEEDRGIDIVGPYACTSTRLVSIGSNCSSKTVY